MSRASQEDEILNFVSKKLATAQLSRRRSQTSTNHNSSTLSRPTRVEKPSSKHASPKVHDRRMHITAPKQIAAINTNIIHDSRLSSSSHPTHDYNQRPERPYSWHPTSYTGQDDAFLPYSAQSATTPVSYPDVWQTSSYAWPGEVQYINQSMAFDFTKSSHIVQQPYQLDAPKFLPGSIDSNHGTQTTWFPQHSELAAMPAYHTGIQINDQESLISNATSSATLGYPHQQMSSFDQAFDRCPQVNHQVVQQSVQRNSNIFHPQNIKKHEDDLVGLGLYDKEEELVSPLQVYSRFSTSAPAQFVGVTPGKGLKLEETWQPPVDWQPGESTEGSESSASPYEETQGYSSFSQELANPAQVPLQQYPLDFGGHDFLFHSDDDWFMNNLKPNLAPEAVFSGCDWFDYTTQNVAYERMTT